MSMSNTNVAGDTIQAKRNLSKYYFYGLLSHLFFERGIFIIYLGYKGLTIPQISLFQGIINAAMMVAEIPTGIIADRIGKKYSLLLGNIMMITYYLLMIYSSSIFGFLCAAIIFGVGSTFVSGTIEAYLYDLVPGKESSVKYLGRLSSIITLALGVAMIAGGYIQLYSWELLLMAGALMQFVGILVLLFLPNIVYEAAASKGQIFAVIDNVKRDKVLLEIAVFLGVNVGMVSASYILGQRILSDFGMPTQYVSLFFFADNIIAMLVFSQVENILRFFGQKKSLVTSFVMMTAGFVLLLADTLWWSAASILIISITSNYTSTLFMDCFYNRIEDSVRATGGSVFNMLSSLIMAGVFGLVSLFGPHYLMIISFAGAMSAVVMLLFSLKTLTMVEE